MNASAQVSVVIPFYRAGDTLPRALGSVAAQTHAVGEVIVVDDASGPESAALLDGLEAAWPSLPLRRVTLAVNGGAAGARNAGWSLAAGEFIAFLDADDAWHPRKIELQLAYMQAHPGVDACGHDHTVAPAAQAQADADAPAVPLNAWTIGRAAMLLRNPFVTPSVMVRRRVSQRFEPGQRHMEDHRLWMRMVLESLCVQQIDAALVTIFKPGVGSGGLSGDILKMQAADLRNYLSLRREGLLGMVEAVVLLGWSLLKFGRRLVLLAARKAGAAVGGRS